MNEHIPAPLRGKFLLHYFELAQKHFTEDVEDEVLVLKAHLWLEAMFREFCSQSVPAPEHLQGARLTFKQISLLTRSLAPDESASKVWPAVNHLNSLRNAMAHELEPSKEKMAKLNRLICLAADEQLGKPGLHDLKRAIGFICGFMSAHLQHTLNPNGMAEND